MSGKPMQIQDEVLRSMYEHAREGWPEEVCGLLLGPRDEMRVDEARRCENDQDRLHTEEPKVFTRDARTAYTLTAKDLFFVQKSLSGDRPVKVIYHSHVDVGAYFSDEDKRAALAGGDEPAYPVGYIVIDSRKEGVRGAKLFEWNGADFAQAAEYGKVWVG